MLTRSIQSMLCVCAFCALTTTAVAEPEGGGADPPSSAELFRYFDGIWDDGHTMDVVRFMEKHWRWPGNAGFDASIHEAVRKLELAGYVNEDAAADSDRLTYRLESRPMRRPAWEPVTASLYIRHEDGRRTPVLRFATNQNMIAINSWSTPEGGAVGHLVDARTIDEDDDITGLIVIADGSSYALHRRYVQRRGAAGVLCYGIPRFNQPEVHRDSIPFSSIGLDPRQTGWAINLSFNARETLLELLETNDDPVVQATIETRVYESEELTVVADVRGSTHPDERFVFSAHVQEPGANDNATGVATQLEMARTFGALVTNGTIDPARTMTFLWGDEIRSTGRYMRENAERAEGVLWGMSLDMVGADPEKTGGSFLIEKMPDPSAVWQRGGESFSEWGGRPLSLEDMVPHYLNDFVLNRCKERAATTGWVVNTNPFEGGSDHVPFLRADVPAVLLWHFTDAFYHTDGDRIENISAKTMRNIGLSAIVSATMLCSADEHVESTVLAELTDAATQRLNREFQISVSDMDEGGDRATQESILRAWASWYASAIETIPGLSTTDHEGFDSECSKAAADVLQLADRLIASLPE